MRNHQKKLAFVLVLSAHVAALYLVERSLRLHAPARREEPPPLTVSFLELTSPAAAPSGPAPSSRRQPLPAGPRQAPLEPAAAPEPSTAITDWEAQGQAAARNMAATANRPPHPFGHEFAPAPERSESSVFGPRNEHPAGTVEQTEEGERHWVTDNCYFDFERHPEAALIAGPRAMAPTCKPPATGGTDLFKKLRPSYLTSPPASGDPH